MRLFNLLCLILFSTAASAEKNTHFEITPLVGYRFNSHFDTTTPTPAVPTKIKLNEDTSYGLLLAWDYDKKRQSELLVSHFTSKLSQGVNLTESNNNLSISYVHIGGNVPISNGIIPFFITGGLGLTNFSLKDSQLSSENRFSMNIGLATKIFVSNAVSFRLGGRVYATFFNSDSEIFCNNNNCAISISSDMWLQSEVNAGITVTF